LHSDYQAAEKPGQDDDGQAPDADIIHLESDVVGVVGRAEYVSNGPPSQDIEVSESCDGRLQEIEQTDSISPMLP
jgi:hypothetical protein